MIRYQPFPDLDNAEPDGLLAMGGDLSVDTLVSAYSQGVFPWFNEGQPILWWSPNPRLVLFPERIKISRSLKKSSKKYQVTCNSAFEKVVEGCALRGRSAASHVSNTAKEDTWITDQMASAYSDLFRNGYAHSVEVWQQGKLVGGLYGVALGNVFFGESMFSRANDASKVALTYLCEHLLRKNFSLIDCQVTSDHLLTLGAEEIPRPQFITKLDNIDINKPYLNFNDNFPNSSDELKSLFSRNNVISNL